MLNGLPLFSEIKVGRETDSYIEIQGAPNTTLPEGTYFVAMHGDQGNFDYSAGKVNAVIDLGGLSYGSNGYLVINQANSPYTVDPNANVISGTDGFEGLPDGRYSSVNPFDKGHFHYTTSPTYFLVASPVAPVAGSDYDSDDDGVLEGLAANWTVHDSVSRIPVHPNGVEVAYSDVVFRSYQQGSVGAALDPIMPENATIIDFHSDYMIRIGTGSTERDWIALVEDSSDQTIVNASYPEFIGQPAFSDVGSSNFPNVQLVGGHVGEYPGTGAFNDIAISETRLARNVDESNYFMELAGPSNGLIPYGTYLVQLDGFGVLKMVVDLGNLEFGENGTLILLAGGNEFTNINSQTNTIEGTDWFEGMPDFRQQGGMIYLGYRSILLIQSPNRPRTEDFTIDYDWNNDGVLDDQAEHWNIIDGFGILGSPDGSSPSSMAYGDIVIRHHSGRQSDNHNASLVIDTPSFEYLDRIGPGDNANDYVLGRMEDIGQANYVITNALYTPYPNDDVNGYATSIGVASASFNFSGGGNNGGGNNGGNNGGGDPVVEDILGRASSGEWWAAVSDGTKFNNSFVAQWATNTGWHDVQLADVNGDGLDDLVGRNDAGDLYVSLADEGGQRTFQKWGNLSPSVTWEDVNAADVNGDGRADLVGRANGQWWVAVSQGSFFTIEFWGRWSNSVVWEDVRVGDFNGDGQDDVAGRTNGDWWLARSTGQFFITEHWGRWSNAVTWEDVIAADFNGDGRDDLAGRQSGNWWLARSSTNDNFVTEFWGRWSNSVAWDDVLSGDFNGDGRDDIAGRTSGDWWLARSSGNDNFITEFWGRWSDVAWADVSKGDFNGDGADDIAGRFGNDWWVQKSDTSKFQSEHWGGWGSTTWSDVKVGHHRGPRS